MLWSGPARVVSSGEATTFFGSPLLLAVELDEGPLTVEWVFEESDDGTVHLEPITGGQRLRCRGIDDTPGKGTSDPVPLETRGDDTLMLHFRSTRWGRSADRTVHWTIFRVPTAALVEWATPGVDDASLLGE